MFCDAYTPNKSGVVSAMQLEKRELEKLGHHVYIVSVGNIQPDDGETVLRIRSVPAIGVKAHQNIRLGIFDRARLKKFFHGVKIDIVHTHSEVNLGWLGYYFARSHGVPVVHTFHTMWEEYKNQYMVGKVLPTRVLRKMLELFLTRVDYITTPTQKSAHYIQKLLPGYTSLQIVQNGIPFATQRTSKQSRLVLRKKYHIPEQAIVAIFAGRMSDEKRVTELYRVYKIAMQRIPNLHLILAGDGQSLPAIKKRIQHDKLGDRIHVFGFVPLSTVQELNALSDITTTASLSETSNMSILEGISSGLAVIARNDECLVGEVKNKVNGFLCKDEMEMVERLEEVAENTKLLEFCQSTNAKAAAKYSAQQHVKNLLKVYTKVLKAHQSSRKGLA